MTHRTNPYATPELMGLVAPLIEYSRTVESMGLEPALLELVKIRASQINGCGVCLNMHTQDARRAGESEQRIFMLDAWRESPLYTDRERAALAWTETLTRLSETHAPDEEYALMAAQFTPGEQVKLTLEISVINSFNRLGAGFRVKHPLGKSTAHAA
jgi:AhpD family alkylhydroperoxidase